MSAFLASADSVACARLSTDALPCLARWRDRADIRVVVQNDFLWVFWPASDDAIARHLLALPGARLAYHNGDTWMRKGEHLPIFDVPDRETAITLDRILAPESLPRPPIARPTITPLTVHLVRDEMPRKTTALCLPLAALAAWADSALTDDIEGLEMALRDGEALLLGRLPTLGGERFWGRELLIPAGWRPEPNLAERTLAEAFGLGEDLALFTRAGVEIVPRTAFGPLTRAGIRLAVRSQGGQP